MLKVTVPVAVTFATFEMFPERKALPWTERFCVGVPVPTPKLVLVKRATSLPPVENPIVLAAGKYRPVAVSPALPNDGALTEPALASRRAVTPI